MSLVRRLLMAPPLAAVALLLLAGSCNGPPQSDPADPDPPVVVATEPADGATEVALDATIQVAFSHEMDQAATEAAFGATPQIDCAFSWNALPTALTCVPGNSLGNNVTYTVSIDAAAKDAQGIPLEQPYTFSFTTADAPTAPEVVVTISSPSETIHTNGQLTVQVAVSGATPEAVELHRDGVLLVALESPYTYLWDTTSDPEGNYQLTAVATVSGEVVTSKPRTVIIDRTNPTVVSRTPMPGAHNVWIRDPIEVRFSEPIAPNTISASSVALTAGEGASLDSELTLSEDGRELAIGLQESPSVPAELTVSLEDTITDLAGNPLTQPPDVWIWSLPAWHVMGAYLNVDPEIGAQRPRIAIDGLNRPIVAWLEDWPDSKPPSDVYVKRWNGQAWQQLGGALNGDSLAMYGWVSVAVDSADDPIVAFTQPLRSTSSDGAGYVKRWDGSDWQTLGGPFNESLDERTQEVDMAIDSDDAPVIAWSESDGSGFRLYVRRWGEVPCEAVPTVQQIDRACFGWQPLGEALNRETADTVWARWPSLVLDGSDHPIVAWTEGSEDESGDFETFVHVSRWTDSGWQALGGRLRISHSDFAVLPSLAIDETGTIYAAWLQDGGRGFVYRWSGTTWESMRFNRVDSSREARDIGLTVDRSNLPIAAWTEYDPATRTTYAYVARREAGAWRQVGEPVTPASSMLGIDVTTDHDDTAHLVLPAFDGVSHKLHVRRDNRLP